MKKIILLVLMSSLILNFVFGESKNEEKEKADTGKKIENLREKQDNKEEFEKNKTKGRDDKEKNPLSIHSETEDKVLKPEDKILNEEKEGFGMKVLRMLGFKKKENGKKKGNEKEKQDDNKILNAQDVKRPGQIIKTPETPKEEEKEKEDDNDEKKKSSLPDENENLNNKIERPHKEN
mgnify:CR=1 FL=1